MLVVLTYVLEKNSLAYRVAKQAERAQRKRYGMKVPEINRPHPRRHPEGRLDERALSSARE
jgi:hypothetical protein